MKWLADILAALGMLCLVGALTFLAWAVSAPTHLHF